MTADIALVSVVICVDIKCSERFSLRASAQAGSRRRSRRRGEEEKRTESHRWRSHRCADLVAFTPKRTDQITPLTQKERTLKATREERGEERGGEREEDKKA
jgi:hypothetical protein